VTQHQNLFDLALCFFAALTHASHFFSFKLSSFLFSFASTIILIFIIHWSRCTYIRWSKIIWSMIEIFLSVYLFTCTYLHLSLSSLYAYISIFISFYDSFSCFNASVHAVLIIIRSINLLNLILRMYLDWSRQVELKFFWKSVELSWEVELKNLNRVEKLDLTTQFENLTQLNKILDRCK